MSISSSAPKQMQVRVTFFTNHNPQSVLMILKHDCALEQIAEKARQLFPTSEHRLFYGDVNGPIYEFVDSDQVMAKIRITSFSRTPQLFVRLEPLSVLFGTTKKTKERESKSSSSLKRIEQNQEEAMKSLVKLQKEFDRVTQLEEAVVELQKKLDSSQPVAEPKKKNIKPAKHSATCDACLGDIVGHRYKCLECPDYDLCESCEKNSIHYDHAMIRLVCPRKTTIPSYITTNAPNNVFPPYMRTHVIHLDIPFPAATEPKKTEESNKFSSDSQPPSDFRTETRAALVQSANVLKDTFHVLSKSFLDLADGAQTGMDKKIFERSKLEAGMAMVEDKIELLTRQCDEKYFGVPEEKFQAKEEDPSSICPHESVEDTLNKYLAPYEPKIKRSCKKKSVYKKSAAKLPTGLFAAMDKEDAKRRADASTAELQKKLAELNVPKTEEPRTEPVLHGPGFPGYEHFGDYLHIGSGPGRGISFADWYKDDQLNSLLRVGEDNTALGYFNAAAEAVSAAPATAPVYPSIPTVPLVETAPIQPEEKKQEAKEETVAKQTSPDSIHSSFENIASDLESISPTWALGVSELIASELAAGAAVNAIRAPSTPPTVPVVPEMRVVDSSDDDMEYYDGEETVQQPPQPVNEPALSVIDAETERTFDRLLEMGFDYNVVVAAIKKNGSDLQKCLQMLIQ